MSKIVGAARVGLEVRSPTAMVSSEILFLGVPEVVGYGEVEGGCWLVGEDPGERAGGRALDRTVVLPGVGDRGGKIVRRWRTLGL